MRWILGLVGAVLGSVVGDELGLALGAAFGFMVGYAIERERLRNTQLAAGQKLGGPQAPFEQRATARILELMKRVEALERSVAELRAAHQSAQPAPVEAAPAAPTPVDAAPVVPAALPLDERGAPVTPASWREYYEEQEERAQSEARAREAASVPATPATAAPAADHSVANDAPPPRMEMPGSAAFDALRSFLFGGNTVVRVGILILTIGVGLLVKYAADQAYFPLELRLAFAAALGLGLVVIGYLQRDKRPGFGTALQGGGVAAMYLVTFFSYYAYQLLPAPLTMGLLIALAALSSILAVLQNAQQLAVFGAIGGFLSPVLASKGGGSHIALFSYYALLNLAICGIALFRSWRILNYTGFLFTFGIASAWGALQYKPEHMLSASCFLALFFLIYVIDGTLFALQKPADRRGTIDTTLTFGTPLATLALAGGLFHEQHLFLALACVFIASVYVGFAGALVMTRDAALLQLARAYVAVGIGVGTLAIPFALDDSLGTALAWAAEACGLVWVGIRQQRLRTRVAGYVLFFGSLIALLAHADEGPTPVRALFCALIAIGMFGASALVEKHADLVRSAEPYVGRVLFGVSLLVWGGGCDALNDSALPFAFRPLGWLLEIAFTTLALELVGTRVSFRAARATSTFAPAILLFWSVVAASAGSVVHPTASFGWLGWPVAFASVLFALLRNDASLRGYARYLDAMHAALAYLLAFLIVWETEHWAHDVFSLPAGWIAGAFLLAPSLVALVARNGAPSWPLREHARGYLLWASWPMLLIASLCSLIIQASNDGSALPLSYLPLLNPIDLSVAILVVTLLWVARSEAVHGPRTEKLARWCAALVGFCDLNGSVVRTAHHWAQVPFAEWDVPTAPVVQASFSILWTTLALIAMLVAHRKRARGVWVAGAGLLAAVVVKLFFVDLSSLSGVAKIITFLAVGVLLLLIGYFAPVPPAQDAPAVAPQPEKP